MAKMMNTKKVLGSAPGAPPSKSEPDKVMVKKTSSALPTKDPRLEGKYNPQVVSKVTRTVIPKPPKSNGLTIRAEKDWTTERPSVLGKKKS